jgi:3-oxoacyl-[acyl-carrier protein] reductase
VTPDSLGLKGRVAVVTGASRGIGRAVAEMFAQCGTNVVVNFLKNDKDAQEVVQELKRLGVDAIAVQADIATTDGARKLIQESIAHFQRIDFLICNAGIWEGSPIESMSEELWNRTIEINLKGTWTVCREAVPTMKEQGSGRIVIISSTAGQRGEPFYSNYAASKGGQISFTKALSSELGPSGINVNAVAPGWVDTEMSAAALSNETERAAIEAAIPIRRVATAHDIAGSVVFLCSEWSRNINGEILNVNGGSVLCG